MPQEYYLTDAINFILGLFQQLAQKRSTLPLHYYKKLLNETYIKYFGCDRRAIKTFDADFLIKSYCNTNHFHAQKSLLLVWLFLEEASFINPGSEKNRLINLAKTLYHTMADLLPPEIFTLIAARLEDKLEVITI